MELELGGEAELPTDIPAYHSTDSPKPLPPSSQGSPSLELSITRAWENSLGRGTHAALLLPKRWGAQGDLRGRLTSGARVSWDTRDLCQRGEVGPREHEPVPGSTSRPALLMRDNEVHLISAADLPPGHGGCRQSPRQGAAAMEERGQEGTPAGGSAGLGAACQGLIQPPSVTPADSRGGFSPLQTSPG